MEFKSIFWILRRYLDNNVGRLEGYCRGRIGCFEGLLLKYTLVLFFVPFENFQEYPDI